LRLKDKNRRGKRRGLDQDEAGLWFIVVANTRVQGTKGF
jgi:hypothetical protein